MSKKVYFSLIENCFNITILLLNILDNQPSNPIGSLPPMNTSILCRCDTKILHIFCFWESNTRRSILLLDQSRKKRLFYIQKVNSLAKLGIHGGILFYDTRQKKRFCFFLLLEKMFISFLRIFFSEVKMEEDWHEDHR